MIDSSQNIGCPSCGRDWNEANDRYLYIGATMACFIDINIPEQIIQGVLVFVYDRPFYLVLQQFTLHCLNKNYK
jgi:hypothetical protein